MSFIYIYRILLKKPYHWLHFLQSYFTINILVPSSVPIDIPSYRPSSFPYLYQFLRDSFKWTIALIVSRSFRGTRFVFNFIFKYEKNRSKNPSSNPYSIATSYWIKDPSINTYLIPYSDLSYLVNSDSILDFYRILLKDWR